MPIKNEIGSVFGRLTVVQSAASVGEKAMWVCNCSCGKTHTVSGDALRTGKVKSCGCYRKSGDFKRTHGQSSYLKGVSSTYKSWQEMRARCTNPRHISYPNYGGRGITFDPAWCDFDTFFRDMGSCPDGMSLDRIKNHLGYSKDNCTWSDRFTQNANRRNVDLIEHKGKVQNLAAWCRELDIPYQRTYYRLVIKQESFAMAISPKRKLGIQC